MSIKHITGICCFVAALAIACGEEEDVDKLEDGVYTINEPICTSTGAAPAYSSGTIRALFHQFDVTTHTMTISGATTVETLADADCTVTTTETLAKNEKNEVQWQQTEANTFSPGGCTLSVTHNGVVTEVGKGADGDSAFNPFVDSTSTSASSVVYSLTINDNFYTLTSATADWSFAGCGTSDSLQITYVKQ